MRRTLVAAALLLNALVAQAATWTPSADALLQFAEANFPNLFPGPQGNRFLSGFTYRFYPKTGNYVGVANGTVYIAGAIAGGVVRPVGNLADFSCAINPSGCNPPTLQPVAGAPASDVPGSSTVPGITARLVSPASVTGELFQGQAIDTVYLNAFASGDMTQLAGRTLYVVIVDPHSLFNTRPSVAITSATTTSGSLSITLSGKTLTQSGLMTGTLKVYGCLDAACSTQIAGTPLTLPYSVSAWPDISTDATQVSVSVPFGQAASTRAVQVNLPHGTTGWNATLVGSNINATSPVTVSANTLWGNTTGTATLRMAPAAPGTYTATLRIQGAATLSNNRTNYFTKDVPVTYTVTAAASPDYVFEPSETAVYCKGSDCGNIAYSRTAAANTGATLTWGGIEYLSAPGAAASHSHVNSWWSELNYLPSLCDTSTCLPAGTYTARIRYTLTKGGVTSNVYHPVTMTIN